MDIEIEKDQKATALVHVANAANAQALAVLVRSPHEYEQVSELLSKIKGRYKEIEGYRVYLKDDFLKGCRKIDDFFRLPLKYLEDAENTVKGKLNAYQNEQRRIAAEEQSKLEEKARKDREALEAKARAERENADALAAKMKREADEAREAGDLATAATLRNQANKIVEKSEVKAVAALDRAAQIVAPRVEAYIPPVVGQSSRTAWKARVDDAKAVPDEYKIVDTAMLDKFAQATKGRVTVPGVTFYEERVMSARSKAV